MPKFSIIKDAKKLNESLSKQKTARDGYHKLLHINAVSVLFRTNESGSISEINRFHNLLTANEQTAFRNYVRRFQEAGKDADNKPVLTEYAFLMFKNGEWRIDTTTPVEQRQAGSPFQAYAEKVLINPDGKTSKPFFEQDNVADINLFDDKSVIDSINRLLTTVQNGSTDKREVKVSDPIVSFLTEVAGRAKALGEKLKVEETHKSNVIQLHARPHEAPENVEAAIEKLTAPAKKAKATANVKAKLQATG